MEQRVAMLSAIIKSEIAIKMSIQIINAFVNMRKFLSENAQIFKRMDNLENHQKLTDEKLENIFNAIENKEIKPKQGIFFNGEIGLIRIKRFF